LRGFYRGASGTLNCGPDFLFGIFGVRRGHGDYYVVEFALQVQDAVGCAGYPATLFGSEIVTVVRGLGCWVYSFGLFFQQRDVVDSYAEEWAKTGGLRGKEVGDREGDVGED